MCNHLDVTPPRLTRVLVPDHADLGHRRVGREEALEDVLGDIFIDARHLEDGGGGVGFRVEGLT